MLYSYTVDTERLNCYSRLQSVHMNYKMLFKIIIIIIARRLRIRRCMRKEKKGRKWKMALIPIFPEEGH